METIELKFLLTLLGKTDYRCLIKDLSLNKGTTASKRDKICSDFTRQDILAHSYEIRKFKLEPSGKALLEMDASESPLTAEQLAVLRACQQKAATPGEIKKVAAADRQKILQDVEAKGFIKAEQVTIREVWLTDRGQEYLREDLNVNGRNPVINLDLLQNYVTFLRKELCTTGSSKLGASFDSVASETSDAVNDSSSRSSIGSTATIDSNDKPNDTEVLQLIQQLDRELGTENYLPIFHLRQKLQPPFSRDELDQVLYRLQRHDRIELNSLVEAVRYTSEQVQAGIPQEAGGPLFFIVVAD